MSFPELWSMPVMSNMPKVTTPFCGTGLRPHRQSFPLIGWLGFMSPASASCPVYTSNKSQPRQLGTTRRRAHRFPGCFPLALDVSTTYALMPTAGLPLTSPHSAFYQDPEEERGYRCGQHLSTRSVWPLHLGCLTH